MKRIALIIIGICGVLVPLSIVGRSNPLSLAVIVPLVACAGIFSYRSTKFIFPFIFLLLPITGLLNIIFSIRGVPSTLAFPYACLIGLALRKEEISFRQIPNGVVFFVIGCLFSVGVALIKLPLMDSSPLFHAWGWIFKEALVVFSGPLIFFFWLCSPPCNRVRSLILFVPLLIPVLGGAAQFLGGSTFSLNPVYFNNGYPQQFNATYSDPNALGLSCALLFLVLISFLVGRPRSILLWFSSMGLIFLIYIAGSRSSFVLLIVSMAIFLPLLFRKKAKVIFFLLVLVSALLIGLSFSQRVFLKKSYRINLLMTRVDSVLKGHLTLGDLMLDRKISWKAGETVFKHNPVLGVGMGAYLIQMPLYGDEIGKVINDNPGSQYLQIAAEQGVVGVLIFLFLMGSLFVKFLQSQHKSMMQWGAFSSLCGMLVAFIFGAHLLNFEVNVLFWFLLAVLHEQQGGPEAFATIPKKIKG